MNINQLPNTNQSYPQTVTKTDEVKTNGTSFKMKGGDKDITGWVMAGLALPCIASIIGSLYTCSGYHSTEPKEQDSIVAPAPNNEPVMDAKTVVLPPLTMVDGIDTLEFKSRTDSLEYRKYAEIARTSHDKIEKDARHKRDSIISTVKKEYETVKAEADKVLNPKLNEIDRKYDAQLKDAEKQYNDGKMTFSAFDAKKQSIEQNRMNENSAAYGVYNEKVNTAKDKYRSTEKTENDKFYKLKDENDKKMYQDIDAMRKKYCKNVREWQIPKQVLPPLEQNISGLNIKYNSKNDSIKAQKYINERVALMKEHKAEFDKLSKEEDALWDKVSELNEKIDETDYEGEKYNKLETQRIKLQDKIDNLQTKIGDMVEKYGLEMKEIQKYGKTNFSSNEYYWTD